MQYTNLQQTDQRLYRSLLRGEFGIEKESMRVDESGHLAETSHPQGLGAHISRDFGEGQVEFISGVYDDLNDACEEICALQKEVEDAIQEEEYMWTYSNPPLFGTEQNIRIAEFDGGGGEKTAYRNYLAEKYGRVKMLFSGVHLNYSMPQEFFELLQRKMPDRDLSEIRSEWYVKLCDALMSDSWLIVALTSASPVADAGFLKALGVPKEEWEAYASFRNSRYGYWNLFLPELSYESFSSYLESIERYIRQGKIRSIQELYYPIRLKPAGENSLFHLKESGVNHIELRMLDLNPMCCAGVAKQDLVFIHLLIAFRTAELLHFCNGPKRRFDDRTHTPERARLLLHKEAARIDFWEEQKACRAYAYGLLQDMKKFFGAYEMQTDAYVPSDYAVMEALTREEQKILNPSLRYANKIRRQCRMDDYIGARMREIKSGL